MVAPPPNNRLPNELVLVTACCRWPRSPSHGASIRDAAAAQIDWPQLFRVAVKHRVVPLVHEGLQRAGIAVPAPTADQLAERARNSARSSLAQASETVRLQAAFDRTGLPLVQVKGASLAVLAYGDIGIKQAHDIDMLTTPEAAPAGKHLLETLGYRMRDLRAHDEATFLRFISRAREALFVNDETRIITELQWRLFNNPMLVPGIDASSPIQSCQIGGTAIRTLADDELFAYLCVHGARHAWSRLKWLVDVAALLAQRDGTEIERLHRRAIELGAGRTSGVALVLSHRLLGLNVPEELLQEIVRDRALRVLVGNAMACIAYGQGAGAMDAANPRVRTAASHFLLHPGGRFLRTEIGIRKRALANRRFYRLFAALR